ncbi:MAG: exodeoxyribonuclease VII small subunit [Prevotella sp.]|nr:exodeoxyribonuclease VII small subunit [Prevotella sp.]
MNCEMKYEEALKKLETIVSKMEAGEYDIDELTEQLKEAQKLIKLCRDKLTKTDAEINKILAKGE